MRILCTSTSFTGVARSKLRSCAKLIAANHDQIVRSSPIPQARGLRRCAKLAVYPGCFVTTAKLWTRTQIHRLARVLSPSLSDKKPLVTDYLHGWPLDRYTVWGSVAVVHTICNITTTTIVWFHVWIRWWAWRSFPANSSTDDVRVSWAQKGVGGGV